MSALRDPAPEREREEFLARATHELRSPMCAISGLAELLRDRRDRLSKEQSDEILDALLRQSEYVTRLIDSLVDLARIDSGLVAMTLEAVDVRALAEDIAAAAPPPAGKTLTIDIAGRGKVLADRLRLEQVFRNLLRNAYEYGGERITIVGRRARGRYEVMVCDDGPGVPDELVPFLFQPLVRGPTSPGATQGAGLGLSICWKLIEAAGGIIRYVPGPRGACFTMNLARP